MKKKKFTVLTAALVLAAVTVLTACGSANADVSEIAGDGADSATVTDTGEGEDSSGEVTAEESGTPTPTDEELAAAAEQTLQTAPSVAESYTDVPYASQSENQVFDITIPEGEGSFPVIVAIHGGGFALGDRHDAVTTAICDQAQAHGYVAVNMEYRTVDEARFPGALADVKGLVRFLRAHAEEYRIDPDNITLWGQSAGAYLAATAALTPDIPELNSDVTDNLDQSSLVRAFVDFSGPIAFNEVMDDFTAAGMYPEEPTDLQMFISAFLGFDPATDMTRVNESYWATYADRLPADFKCTAYIAHGTGDWAVPYLQSVHFAERLTPVLGEESVKLELYDGAEHEATVYYEPVNMEKVFQFLR